MRLRVKDIRQPLTYQALTIIIVMQRYAVRFINNCLRRLKLTHRSC